MAYSIEESNKLSASLVKEGKYKYLYGGKDQAYTIALVNTLAKRYPSVFTASIKKLALADAGKGYRCIDCSGFVCKVLGLGVSAMGSSQLRSSAVKRLPVTRANAKPGMALWRSGHIAYVGEGLVIREAKGTASDLTEASWESRSGAFKELLVIKGSALAATYNSTTTSTTKAKNPYTEPTKCVCMASAAKKAKITNYITSGEGVKWVQYELKEAGCLGKDGKELKIDGDCGANTNYAIGSFQKSCKITVDYVCGKGTRTKLKL